MRIAINGFGRIGRATLRAIIDRKLPIKVAAINDLTDIGTLVYLLNNDSVYGRFDKMAVATKSGIKIGNTAVTVTAESDPAHLPWKEMQIDLVLECTGRFRTKEAVSSHLKAGAKKVILSAPPKGQGFKTIVLGVNEQKLKKSDRYISNASCTTNCLAPVTAVIKENFGIKKAIMTTVHAYTADQNLVDGPHKDLRRARAAALNIVPTTTGAAIAATDTIPSLKGNFDGMAIRVPVPVGSLCDITYVTNKKTNIKDINNAFKKAANSARFKGIIRATFDPLVSSDIVGDPHSSIVDLSVTNVVGGDLVKVVAWYDNEWGYSNRMADLACYIQSKKLI